MVHTFNPSTLGGRGRWISMSLRPAYRASSRTAKATKRNPIWKTNYSLYLLSPPKRKALVQCNWMLLSSGMVHNMENLSTFCPIFAPTYSRKVSALGLLIWIWTWPKPSGILPVPAACSLITSCKNSLCNLQFCMLHLHTLGAPHCAGAQLLMNCAEHSWYLCCSTKTFVLNRRAILI